MQTALGQRPSPEHHEFQFETAYPPDCLVITGIGTCMYQYTFLRHLWTMYCNTPDLHTWTQCRAYHAYLFLTHWKDLLTHDHTRVLRHSSQNPNPHLHMDRRRRGDRPRDTPSYCTADEVYRWRHYKKLISALRLATASTIEVDVPTTDPPLLQAKHSFDPGTSVLGGWYSLPQYTRRNCGCNGTYIP